MSLPFENLSESYDLARPHYPDDVIKIVTSAIFEHCDQTSTVVDMGCGTGISTRQLSEETKLNIIGVDPDPKMIEKAKAKGPSDITYVTSFANDFRPNSPIDAITMFASLHWFSDSASMRNLKSILHPTGIVIAVNRIDGDFRDTIRDIIKTISNRYIADVKEGFLHKDVFLNNGFKIIQSSQIEHIETFNKASLTNYVKSMSVFNYLEPQDQNTALKQICETLLDSEGICNREVTFKITVADIDPKIT